MAKSLPFELLPAALSIPVDGSNEKSTYAERTIHHRNKSVGNYIGD